MGIFYLFFIKKVASVYDNPQHANCNANYKIVAYREVQAMQKMIRFRRILHDF